MADTVIETLPPVEETAPGADINSPTGANGLFIVCKTDGFAEFYDPKTLARVDEIKLPDFPHEVMLSPDRATAYVSIYGNGQVGTNTRPGTQIAVIDLASRKLTGFIELDPYLAPHGQPLGDGRTLQRDHGGRSQARRRDRRRAARQSPQPFPRRDARRREGYVPHRQLKFMSVVDTDSRRQVKRITNFSSGSSSSADRWASPFPTARPPS
jgi:hypothetical protein